MAEVHDAVPLRLAQGENLARTPGLGGSKHRDVDLDLRPVGGVRDYPGSHLARRAAEEVGIARDRVVAADRFEMRPGQLRQETRASPGPDDWRTAEFETCPFPAHDGLVEGDKRLGDPVFRPARPEQVGLPDQQPGILQHPEG